MQRVRRGEFEARAVGSGSRRSRAAAFTPERVRSLRRWAARRRSAGLLLLLTPVVASVLWDVSRRGERLRTLDRMHLACYAGAVLESFVIWAALLHASARRRGKARWLARVLFVLGVTFAFGGQAYFYQQYHAYLNVDVSRFASNLMDSVINQLFADFGNYLHAKLPPLVGSLALLWGACRVLRPRRRLARLTSVAAPLLLVAGFFVPTQHRHLQAATPDALYLNAIGGLLETQLGFTEQSNQLRPRVRQSLPVPPLYGRPSRPRNVLFVILESVRSDSVCIEYDPDCEKTPYTNALAKQRFPLFNMRSLDSSTAISLAVLWTGVGPHESRDTLHAWPLIFDYAKAAGYDTAFWTSQNMMFGNARLWVKNLAVRKFVSATDLDPTSDLDMGAPEGLLAEHVARELATLREPYLAVVQLSNVHYPYFVDPNGPQPFQPATTSKAPDENGSFKNYYQNAVHQQDRHVAAILRALRGSDAGKRTVVVYTSDHGEAFREHNQMGHTFSVFDEEIHVPAWIDAPPGTLSDSEVASLRSKSEAYVFHVDLTPTVLDLIGVWDDPGIARYKPKMLGSSLLRPELTLRPLPMTNCAGVWSCAFENWGYMQGNMKLAARSWNAGWECYDVASDPSESKNLGASRCGALLDHSLATFARLPGAESANR